MEKEKNHELFHNNTVGSDLGNNRMYLEGKIGSSLLP